MVKINPVLNSMNMKETTQQIVSNGKGSNASLENSKEGLSPKCEITVLPVAHAF